MIKFNRNEIIHAPLLSSADSDKGSELVLLPPLSNGLQWAGRTGALFLNQLAATSLVNNKHTQKMKNCNKSDRAREYRPSWADNMWCMTRQSNAS